MNAAADDIETGRNTLRQRAARRRREVRIRFWRAFSMSSFFVVALGANLYIGAVVMMGNFGNPFVVSKAPAHSTVQIKRPLLDRTFCRNTVFDNATSHAIEEKIERCDQAASRQPVRAKTQFIWGGR